MVNEFHAGTEIQHTTRMDHFLIEASTWHSTRLLVLLRGCQVTGLPDTTAPSYIIAEGVEQTR